MIYLFDTTIFYTHDQIIEKTGGLAGYNNINIGYLLSALEHIKNDEFYPTFTDKLAHLIFSCVKFHPFLDGNKRTAIYIGAIFSKLNYIDFNSTAFIEKMEDVVVELAENKITKDELINIINALLKEQ